MTEDDFRDRVDAWALGALAADERAELEAFVVAHPDLREVMRRAFTTAGALAAALPPSPPPPGTWGRIAAALPGAGAHAAVPLPRRRWGALGWSAAAIAAALALWLWFDRDRVRQDQATLRKQLAVLEERTRAAGPLAESVRAAQGRLDDCQRDLDVMRTRDALAGEAVALLELAGTQLIPLEPLESPTTPVAANAIYHRGVKKAYVMVKGLADAPGGYQIWVNRGGQRLAAGALATSVDGGVIASVSANTLDDVPESIEVTRASGEVVLRSRIKI